MEKFEALKTRISEVHDINKAVSVLSWDQHTQMPPGGATARAYVLSTLSNLSHRIFASDETGALLDAAASELNGIGYDSFEASLLRLVRRDYERALKLPGEFVAEFAQARSLGQGIWAKARAANDFKAFEPALEKMVELVHRMSEYLGYTDHPYDALLDQFEPGMKTAEVREIFDELKQGLVPLVQAISQNLDRVDDNMLHQNFDESKQRDFSIAIAKQFGYDFNRGRLDPTVHPFATGFSVDDVRITTRYYPDFLNPSVFGTMHETGHALYELGVDPLFERTPLARGASSAIHESQSRLWENIVGRSRQFWTFFFPKLQETFPQQFGNATMEDFYHAINRVNPSFIRVEADEVTYSLHIMLRFELEQELLTGEVKVHDLPEAWNARMQSYLGVTPPTDAQGVLQDVHWSGGLYGYFPTYALGNLISLQLWEKALAEHPDLPDLVAKGDLATLREWLRVNVHQHGRKYMPQELIKRVTGEGIQSRSFVRYLQAKFGEIYDL